MNKKKREQRSNKWAFLLYQESMPEDYLDILEELHIPFILSPWHDKDINRSTGEFKKTINTAHYFLKPSKAIHRFQIY